MRRPPKGDLWLHVDRLDRDDGKVWAVQFWENGRHRYQVASGVVLRAPSFTQFYGAKASQPKAVIVVPGASCAVFDGVAVVTQLGEELTVEPNLATVSARKRKAGRR